MFRRDFRHAACTAGRGPASAALFLAGGIGVGRSAPLPDNDEVRESVVRIEVENGKAMRQGTGFIINDRRVVATNNHVIEVPRRSM